MWLGNIFCIRYKLSIRLSAVFNSDYSRGVRMANNSHCSQFSLLLVTLASVPATPVSIERLTTIILY